jgi:hypothetical protein
MPPLFRSNVTITLTPDAVNHMLQMLEDNVPLPPDLHDLHQYIIMQAYNQDVVVHAGAHPWGLLEPTPALADDLSSTCNGAYLSDYVMLISYLLVDTKT